MIKEIISINKNKTWVLCDLLLGMIVVSLKLIYKSKLGANGEVHRHRARLLAKGYSQQAGIDFLHLHVSKLFEKS